MVNSNWTDISIIPRLSPLAHFFKKKGIRSWLTQNYQERELRLVPLASGGTSHTFFFITLPFTILSEENGIVRSHIQLSSVKLWYCFISPADSPSWSKMSKRVSKQTTGDLRSRHSSIPSGVAKQSDLKIILTKGSPRGYRRTWGLA